ncbi:hypothetical protein NHX12_011859 [Muraenolepis orangiensis]|uniref:Ig-like domain-containing protein n=1 Tax=Muraenolepis orangiensis TaxID=630683 RepID=A0A9Q0I7L5_9TELE|nr:hypothetical protein NHX12_011859 [Muraenolepis orangiensis]
MTHTMDYLQTPVTCSKSLVYLFKSLIDVSMSMTVVDSDEGRCFSSQIRHLEKAEITLSKMITCPDITDYMTPYKQPTMTCPFSSTFSSSSSSSSPPPPPPQECEQVEWRSSMVVNNTHIWIPEVEESDGGNYTCELQYGSRLVRRTTQLKCTTLPSMVHEDIAPGRCVKRWAPYWGLARRARELESCPLAQLQPPVIYALFSSPPSCHPAPIVQSTLAD